MKKLIVLFVVGMSALAVPPMVAAKSRFYFGIAAGKAAMGQADAIGAAVHESQLAQWSLTEVAEERRKRSQSEFALSATAGATFGRYVSAELTYFNVQPTSYAVLGRSRAPTGEQFSYSQSTDIAVDGPALSVIGRWPIRQRWQVYGRAGMFRSHVKASGFLCGGIFSDCGARTEPATGFSADPVTGPFSNSTSGGGKGVDFEATATNPFLGLGVLFGGDSGGLRLEYSAYRTRNPRDANPDPLPSGYDMPKPPLANINRSGTTHFLSFGFYFAGTDGR